MNFSALVQTACPVELPGPPRRALGQNFTVDRRTLEAVVELASPLEGRVVLEVGGGTGNLSALLAPRVRHLHVVEVDRRLKAALEGALAPFANVTLHWGDALRLDLQGLNPPPTDLVANLPYGIAATLLLNLALTDPRLLRFTVMVQKEVGQRLTALPGPPNPRLYGAPSALLGLCFKVRVARELGRGAFWPRPHVDSVVLVGERFAPPPSPQVVALIRAAFAHRRKPLLRSVALAEPKRFPQDRLARAVAAQGLPPNVRAEQLSPEQLLRLAEGLP